MTRASRFSLAIVSGSTWALVAIRKPSPITKPVPRNWNAQGYLKSIPVDPWGTPYQYLNPGVHSADGSYDLYSLGADGLPGGEGNAADIGNWGH